MQTEKGHHLEEGIKFWNVRKVRFCVLTPFTCVHNFRPIGIHASQDFTDIGRSGGIKYRRAGKTTTAWWWNCSANVLYEHGHGRRKVFSCEASSERSPLAPFPTLKPMFMSDTAAGCRPYIVMNNLHVIIVVIVAVVIYVWCVIIIKRI